MLTGTLPVQSGRSTYVETLEMIDDDTDTPIDLTGADIRVEINYDTSRDDYGRTARSVTTAATLGSGVEIIELGVIQWRFEAGTLSRFCSGSATLSVFVSRDGDTDEIARLTLPIQD